MAKTVAVAINHLAIKEARCNEYFWVVKGILSVGLCFDQLSIFVLLVILLQFCNPHISIHSYSSCRVRSRFQFEKTAPLTHWCARHIQ